jgi:hypothetical protein
MPRYFFSIKDDRRIVSDPEGTELPDEDSALAHACQVVSELTRNREQRTSSWRLAVCDGHGALCFELLFASVDESITRLPPAMRALVENACRNTALLKDEASQVRMTLRRLRGTMAQYDNAPYLASVNGMPL